MCQREDLWFKASGLGPKSAQGLKALDLWGSGAQYLGIAGCTYAV